MTEPIRPTKIEALIEGGVSGQVAVGNYNVQIHADHGAVVHFVPPERQPKPSSRPSPVLLRPRPFRGLLDRQVESDAAVSALRDGLPVEIQGPPGVGKSSLLRHLAYDPQASSLPDGVVHLAARGQPAADLLQSLFDALYEYDRAFKPTEAQLRHSLQGRRALVLLDDVSLRREEVEALLDAAPGCTFVLTSQERILWGEARVVPLAGLPTEDALALFERELGRGLSEEERTAATDLCAAADCHPLRVLQAAALAKEGRRPLAELAREARAGAGPEVVSRWALEQLTGAERRMVAILAAAEGAPVGLEPLQQMAGPDTDRLLARLLERKVVEAHSPRYSLQVDLDGALWEAWQVEQWQERLWVQLTAWAERNPGRICEEAASLRQALESAVAAERWEIVRRLGRAIEAALAVGGRWAAWAQVIGRVLTASERLRDEAGRAWALHQRGTRSLCLGDRQAALDDLTRALGIRESLGDYAGAAVTRHNLGFLAAPPPAPESPASPAPRRSFPRLLAWMLLPVLLILLTLGGLLSKSSAPEPDPSPSEEETAPAEEASPEPEVVPVQTPEPLDEPDAPVDEPPVDETPPDPEELEPSPVDPPAEPPAAAAPGLAVEPTRLRFGSVEVRSAGEPRKVSIVNSGTAPLRLERPALIENPDNAFALRSDCTGTLAPRAGCTAEISFLAREPGRFRAVLEIRDAEEGIRPVTVAISGSVTAPPVVAQGWCCIEGKLSEITEDRCKESQGMFFKTHGRARIACFAARTGCCVDGVFQAEMSADECAQLEGTPMTLIEAGFRCRTSADEPVDDNQEGWCCVNQNVFRTSAVRCRQSGGAYGRTEKEAQDRCSSQGGESR
jgi:outer membrane biosynthesis protein TonB